MKAYQVFDENLINDNIKYKIGKNIENLNF